VQASQASFNACSWEKPRLTSGQLHALLRASDTRSACRRALGVLFGLPAPGIARSLQFAPIRVHPADLQPLERYKLHAGFYAGRHDN